VKRALTILSIAFALRLLLVVVSYWLPTLHLGDAIARQLVFLPLPVTAFTLVGFLLMGKGQARSAMFAQLTAALLSTELLFDIILLADPARLASFEALKYIIELLWVGSLLTSWSAIRNAAVERGVTPAVGYSAAFYFALAMRVGLYAERAYAHRMPVDVHALSGAAAMSILVSLALVLLQLLLVGVARRGT
jgi:hypothetical protein